MKLESSSTSESLRCAGSKLIFVNWWFRWWWLSNTHPSGISFRVLLWILQLRLCLCFMLRTTYILSKTNSNQQQQPLPYEIPKTNTLIDRGGVRSMTEHSNKTWRISQLLRVTVVDVCYPLKRFEEPKRRRTGISESPGLLLSYIHSMPWKLPFSDVFFSSNCSRTLFSLSLWFEISRLVLLFFRVASSHNF